MNLISQIIRKLFFGVLSASPLGASAEVWDQPWDGISSGVSSQQYEDAFELSMYAFDDFTIEDDILFLQRLTVYGKETGNERETRGVWIRISDRPGYGAGGGGLFFQFPGFILSNGTIDVGFTGGSLPRGTWWLSVWIDRPLGTGGQWLWRQTTPVRGSEGYIHNPAGGAGFGTEPIPLSQLPGASGPRDLAFRLEYTPIPEPSSLTVAGFGALFLWLRKKPARAISK